MWGWRCRSVFGGKRVASPPDDLAAGRADWRAVAVWRPLLGGLHDGAAVLHGRGLGRLAVLGQHRAGLVRPVPVGEAGVSHPRGPAGGGGGGARGFAHGFGWERKDRHFFTLMFSKATDASLSPTPDFARIYHLPW